jgi:hypothetical protein
LLKREQKFGNAAQNMALLMNSTDPDLTCSQTMSES